MQGNRDEGVHQAAAIAKALHSHNIGNLYLDESIFNSIFLPAVASNLLWLQKSLGNDIKKTIKKFSGAVEAGFLAIIKCCKSKLDYFTERLHNSISGLETRDKTFICIVVSRFEINFGDIKEAFESKYYKNLESWIKGGTFGDYKSYWPLLACKNKAHVVI